MNTLEFSQEFRKMLKVSIVIFSAVKIDNSIAGFFRNGGGGLTTFVAMDKEGLAFLAVTGKHTVNMAFRTA